MTSPPKRVLISGFRSLDYRLVQTYYNSFLWKTTAPPHVVYEILKRLKLKTYKPEDLFKNLAEGSVGHIVLSKPVLAGVEPSFEWEEVK